ncbi:acetyl-CoA sensor PanZ family protein [Saccharospirillum impatiens]|uniref:acetyl-CoA sensor PanZ family protein n=1 Tax=Saccharospirillum impatiens TaxID=169438 RepID=UPI00146E3E13|nr:acetyl-CoA sensor PanZ family protein [Saccharospirillum impatiens]
MPVTLDLLASTPTPDGTDMQDLTRLTQDMNACACFQAAWAAWQINRSEVSLYAARFNGRIVGVALVQSGCLLSLGVRGLTRGRGVGRRMVSVLAQQQGLTLSAHMDPGLAAFVSACLASTAGQR